MRAFFCIPIADDHCAMLEQTADRLHSATRMKASWVPRQNYHITLRFLGDIREGSIRDLEEACRVASQTVAPFYCVLDRVGAFPSVDRARVLWVGGEVPSAFQYLSDGLSQGLLDLGFPQERKDSMVHATLARIKDRPEPTLSDVIRQLNPIEPLSVLIDRIVLMESVLTGRGAIYTPRFTTRLAAAQP